MLPKPEDVAKAEEWLALVGDNACAACGRTEWGLGEVIGSAARDGAGANIYPALAFVCANCGHMIHVSTRAGGFGGSK